MPGFDAVEVLRNIERFRVTHLFLPPTAYYALLAHPEVGNFDYGSLRAFGSCGIASVARQVQERGRNLWTVYVSVLRADRVSNAADVARPCDGRSGNCRKPSGAASKLWTRTYAVRVAVMDDEGHILAPHERGEIVARGNLVTPGYHNLPEATAEIRTHGWHHTGDVGYMDEDGYLYIVDRKKDMIISGGFNVYSAIVEAALLEAAADRECAVVGAPDEKWGEAVKAIVVLREGQTLTQELVIIHCKTRLGGMKAPKSVEFWPEIPKTPTGKIDKKVIREPFWTDMDRQVS